MIQQQNYDFPVELQKVYLANNEEVPRARAVVRTDINKPIANVSSRYHLVSHKEVVDQAKKFVTLFGEPTSRFHLGRNGVTLVGQYDYKEITKEVKRGDVVGLRVYVENSYNTTKPICFRIGGLRLKCTNGMVGCEDIFSLRFRHTKDQEIVFPTKEAVDHAFCMAIDGWAEYAKLDMSHNDYFENALALTQEGLLPVSWYESQYHARHNEGEQSVWGLYNAATHYVTHNSKAMEVSKVRKLSRIDNWFNEAFNKKEEDNVEVMH